MTENSIPASLLKRIAEAADGYRNGQDLWIVASSHFPHDAEVFFDEASAKNRADADTANLILFGPYNTPGAPSVSTTSKVVSITIEIVEDGISSIRKIDVENVDALFWSISSIDKFAIPYYTSLYGVEEAGRIRTELLKDGSPVILGHTDNTRWLPKPNI